MKFTIIDRLAAHGTNPLLTVEQIKRLKDGEIVFVQFPNEEGASPWRIKTKQFDRLYVYATEIHPYHESPCLLHREISGNGFYPPVTGEFDLKVWKSPVSDYIPEHQLGDEVFATMLWNQK